MTERWQRLMEPYWFDRRGWAQQAAGRLRLAGFDVRVRGAVREGQGPARWWYVVYRGRDTEPGPRERLLAVLAAHPNATYVRVEAIDLRAVLEERRP